MEKGLTFRRKLLTCVAPQIVITGRHWNMQYTLQILDIFCRETHNKYHKTE